MALFDSKDWSFTEKALELATTNPFHPGWRKKEAELLELPVQDLPPMIAYTPGAQLWGAQAVYPEEFDRRICEILARLHGRLKDGQSASEVELNRYELLSVYQLYHKCGRRMDQWVEAAVRSDDKGSGAGSPRRTESAPPDVATLWAEFHNEYVDLLRFKNRELQRKYDPPEHVFACFFLFRRAFYHVFFNIVGMSKPIAKLRSAVWESIVTRDLLGCMQGLHQRMKDFPTLITGDSGTGKERVAEAIGRSQYIPFDRKKGFATNFVKAYRPVNLAALPPLLIEAELFGHVKGSFAGAVRDRIGRLEECPEQGAVFLDEIGELTAEIQVKLLRVLQERSFERVGENEAKPFRGKVIAATNRDLAAEMQAGRFRRDLYFRLSADRINTPSLREQLADRPEDLPLFVEFVCSAVVGKDRAAEFAEEVVGWIERNLPAYAWPGNFRELEQCVRSYTIRRDYHPLEGSQRVPCDPVTNACEALAEAVLAEKANYAEIKRRLFTLVRRGTPTDKEAARRLGVRDYRTVQAHAKAADNRLPESNARVPPD
jgi:DNA-binding NtrC family response regulator